MAVIFISYYDLGDQCPDGRAQLFRPFRDLVISGAQKALIIVKRKTLGVRGIHTDASNLFFNPVFRTEGVEN